MSNSPLVVYTRISPNSNMRTAKKDSIVIHHFGTVNGSIETVGADFSRKERKASANYGVGSDGRVALYVDESRRSQATSNWQVDNRSITIEVQNDGGWPDWHVSDKALAALIELCADICKRNGIPRLNYTGDKSGNLLMHRWFFNTVCPGDYLAGKFPYIAAEVNRLLGADVPTPAPLPESESSGLAIGDVITLIPGTRYTTGKAVPDWVMKKTLYCRAISGSNVTFSIYKTGAVTGTTSAANVRKAGQTVSAPAEVAPEKPSAVLAVGDKVRLVSGAVWINGKRVPDWVIRKELYVRQIYSNGNVTVSIYKTGAVTGTVLRKYLTAKM